MSHFIALGGVIYLVGAGVLLMLVAFFASRDVFRQAGPVTGPPVANGGGGGTPMG